MFWLHLDRLVRNSTFVMRVQTTRSTYESVHQKKKQTIESVQRLFVHEIWSDRIIILWFSSIEVQKKKKNDDARPNHFAKVY